MTAPYVTVGVGSCAAKPTAGPPMFSMPMCCAMVRHASTGTTYDVSSRNRRAAIRISARLRSRGTLGFASTSEMTSCIECRLSKMIAASG